MQKDKHKQFDLGLGQLDIEKSAVGLNVLSSHSAPETWWLALVSASGQGQPVGSPTRWQRRRECLNRACSAVAVESVTAVVVLPELQADPAFGF